MSRLCVEGIYGESVNQTEGIVMVSQGDPVLLNCTYEFPGYPSPFWYVQDPNQPLTLFLRDVGRGGADEGARRGFNAKAERKTASFHLWKPSSELSDSATYYCAVSDTVTRASRGAERKRCRACGGERTRVCKLVGG
ncbi:T-cell receptor alpha chain V region CTL-F3 [Chelonia mydas]|nr:T-cell receptor alpha chain V region CTL-F3 [Chelonia mydas]